MVGKIVEFGYGHGDSVRKLKGGDRVAVMVNNLGGTSNLEMYIMAGELVKEVAAVVGEGNVAKCYVGAFMTSFGMHGISLTVLVLDDEIEGLLEAPTGCKFWQDAEVMKGMPEPVEVGSNDPSNKAPFAEAVSIPDIEALTASAVKSIASSIKEKESDLTKWDSLAGDGDCGITMTRGAEALLQTDLPSDRPAEMMRNIADALSDSMGGTSGALLEIACRKAAEVLVEMQLGGSKPADAKAFKAAFAGGVRELVAAGGATVGSRTMVDALWPAMLKAESGASITEIAKSADDGAKSTTNMKALAGRANYVPDENLKGVPDPGAMAVALIIQVVAGIFK